MGGSNQKPRMRRNFLWPSIETIEDANWATRQAFVAAVLCASVTALFSILAICGVEFVRKTLHLSGLSLIDATSFGLVAVFLHRHSRFAAWSALGLYLIERVYGWIAAPASVTNPIVPIIFTLAFISGVRGTHAYHRLSETTPPESERLAA